jgi:hypothetical protein
VSAGQTNPLSDYLSGELSRAAGASTISYTDVTDHLDGSPAGTPLLVSSYTLGAAGAAPAMPPQLAVCVGYRSAYASDLEHGPTASLPTDDKAQDEGAPATHLGATRPRARDRGRFYFGPLQIIAMASHFNTSISATSELAPAFLADLTVATGIILNTQFPTTAGQINAVVWSRRNAATRQVGFYYIDEGVGTQRRREDTTVNREHTWVALV